MTLARLERARRGETVFVVAPDEPPEGLLQRAWDARRSGATVLALDEGSSELEQVAHESLTVDPRDLLADSTLSSDQFGGNADAYEVTESGLLIPSFDTVQHLVSVAAGEAAATPGRRGLRDRLARLLDAISGPANPRT